MSITKRIEMSEAAGVFSYKSCVWIYMTNTIIFQTTTDRPQQVESRPVQFKAIDSQLPEQVLCHIIAWLAAGNYISEAIPLKPAAFLHVNP
jgi:hypothetical protein